MNESEIGRARAPGRTSRRGFLRLAGGAAALTLPALAACTVAQSDAATVEMTERNQFAPSELAIDKGGVVVWHNGSDTPHSSTCDPALAANKTDAALPQGAESWDSVAVYPGESWTHRFDTPGTYVYFCRFHELDGMIGRITVRG